LLAVDAERSELSFERSSPLCDRGVAQSLVVRLCAGFEGVTTSYLSGLLA